MVTQKQFKEHFRNLLNGKAVYVWGANGEIISQELVGKLFSWYGSSTYNRAYYEAKLEEGAGRIGADCSGAFFPLSKGDKTVRGYYETCPIKGNIKDMPKDIACMVFNANLTHVAAYMGDGTTIEMKSSAENVHEESFNETRWTYYGIPSWLDTAVEENARNYLMKGDQGEAVVEMQNGLIYLGYNIGSYGADGDFGAKTDAAVRAFQSDNGLEVDGEYGPITKAALEKAVAKKKELASGKIYRVQIGAFYNRLYAEEQLKEVKGYGYADAFINTKNGMHRVQVGAFTVKANADRLLAKMKELGYTDAFIA